MKKDYDLSELANKYVLSLNEATQYFGIGEKRMRSLIRNNEDKPWVLMVGSHYRVKRLAFEQWLKTVNNL